MSSRGNLRSGIGCRSACDRFCFLRFSPIRPGRWPGLTARELTEWILADGLPVRLGLQLHKFIWDPAMKGV